jgi:hypothetical protein
MKTEKNNAVNVDDLNGLTETNYKLITITIQDFNPITFSEQCETKLKAINPETVVSYSIGNTQIRTNRGEALIFIATIQHWANLEEFNAWTSEIKRANLLIKP